MDELTANIETNSNGNLIMAERLSTLDLTNLTVAFIGVRRAQEQIIRSRSLWDKDLTIKRSPNSHGPSRAREREADLY